jgi:hypothetical protein
VKTTFWRREFAARREIKGNGPRRMPEARVPPANAGVRTRGQADYADRSRSFRLRCLAGDWGRDPAASRGGGSRSGRGPSGDALRGQMRRRHPIRDAAAIVPTP